MNHHVLPTLSKIVNPECFVVKSPTKREENAKWQRETREGPVRHSTFGDFHIFRQKQIKGLTAWKAERDVQVV